MKITKKHITEMVKGVLSEIRVFYNKKGYWATIEFKDALNDLFKTYGGEYNMALSKFKNSFEGGYTDKSEIEYELKRLKKFVDTFNSAYSKLLINAKSYKPKEINGNNTGSAKSVFSNN